MIISHTVQAGYAYLTGEYLVRCSCGWVRYGRNLDRLYVTALEHCRNPTGDGYVVDGHAGTSNSRISAYPRRLNDA